MSATDNLTAVLYKKGDLRLEQRPVPELVGNEVLLKMSCVGICGSDIHYFVHGRCSSFIVEKPMIIGHEASGVVAKVGPNVKNLKVGDRVAIEPGVPCRFCKFCKEGKYNLCPDMAFCATPPYDGNLSRFYKHPEDFCFKLPDHMSLEEGALLEPLSVGVHACRRGNVGVDSVVLILGSGPIGLVTLLTAKAMGASAVVITDVVESRLVVAKSLGATHTLQVGMQEDEHSIAKRVKELLGDLPTITIDCMGAQATVRTALEATRTGGTAVIVGMAASEVNISLASALAREVDLKGVFRYVNDYPIALDLVATGKINVKPLITHHFDIKETLAAFETARTGKDGAIKVMIHCDK